MPTTAPGIGSVNLVLLLPLMTVVHAAEAIVHVPVVAQAPGWVVHFWKAPAVQVIDCDAYTPPPDAEQLSAGVVQDMPHE